MFCWIFKKNQQLHNIIKELNKKFILITKSLQEKILLYRVIATVLKENRTYIWSFFNDSGKFDFKILWTEKKILKLAIYKLCGVVKKFRSEFEDN